MINYREGCIEELESSASQKNGRTRLLTVTGQLLAPAGQSFSSLDSQYAGTAKIKRSPPGPALSSCEAEYVAGSECRREVAFFLNHLEELPDSAGTELRETPRRRLLRQYGRKVHNGASRV